MRHAAVTAAIDDRVEIEFLSSMFAARTEQGRMTGRSIITAVDRGGLRGDELELSVTDGAVLGSEIPDRVLLQIEGDVEIEEADDRVGDEAQGLLDMHGTVAAEGIGVAGLQVLGRHCRDPGDGLLGALRTSSGGLAR